MSLCELKARRSALLGTVTKKVNAIRAYLLGSVDKHMNECDAEVKKLLDTKTRFDEAHRLLVAHEEVDAKARGFYEDGSTRATHAVVAVIDDFEDWVVHGPSVVPINEGITEAATSDVQGATLDLLGKLHATISDIRGETIASAVRMALTEQEMKHSNETAVLHDRIEQLTKELGRLSLLGQVTNGELDCHTNSRSTSASPRGAGMFHSTARDSGLRERPSLGRGRARGRSRPSSITPVQEPSVGRRGDTSELSWSFAEAANAMKDMMSQTLAQSSTMVASLQAPKVTLQAFSGDPIEYARFMVSFNDLVHGVYDSDRARLLVLVENCKGKARSAIDCCMHMDASVGYREALRILDRKFGSAHVVTQAWLDKVLGYPQLVDGSDLEAFAADVKSCRNSLRSLGSLAELECVSTLQRVIFKLPLHLRNRWRKLVRRTREDGGSKADLLVQLLREAAEDDSDPAFSESVIAKVRNTYGTIGTPKPARANVGSKRYGIYAGDISEGEDDVEAEIHAITRSACAACRSGQHFTSRCRNYRELSPADKLDFVRSKKLCLLCLSDSHSVASCPLPWKCQDKACGRKHHTSLHASFEAIRPRGPSVVGPRPPESNAVNHVDELVDGTGTTYETSEGSAYGVLCAGNLPIAKVTVRFGDRSLDTYALLDSGATLTLIRKDIVRSLGVPVQGRTKMAISTIGGKTLVDSDMVSLHMSECTNKIKLPLHKAMAVEKINIAMRGLASSEDIAKFPHLRNLRFHRGDEHHVGLLIGQNNAHLFDPVEVVRGGYYDPYAVGTPLGWVLYGNTKEDFERGDKLMPPHSGRQSTWQPSRMANAVEVDEAVVEAEVNFLDTLSHQVDEVDSWMCDRPSDVCIREDDCEFVGCACGDTDLLSVLEKLAALDKVPDADTLTKEERYVLDLWEREIEFDETGRVIIPMPFKSDPPDLINNFVAAYRALIHLGNQLLKDKERLRQYREAVLAYFDKGYAEIIKDEAPSLTRFVWYMLHHGVDHPRKPGVTRVVKHGGAKYKGRCLNTAAYQGPNLMNNLSEVLTRFRQFEVATTSDIESMFNQVLVPERQRDYSRFLFWEDGDPTKRVIVCRMKTHIFGTIWAPAAANFALKEMAELETKPLVREAIDKEFYVDNWPGSHPTVSDAVSMFNDVRTAVAKGGFNLVKLTSNSREVLRRTSRELHVKALSKIDLSVDGLPDEVLLGQNWFPESDEFGFKVSLEPRPFTRRGMTSCIASLYDPLGLIAPFILPAKLLLQSSCKSGSGWDEELLGATCTQWSAWLEQLPEIEEFRLRRWFGCTRSSKQFIHMFSDASKRAYGAVSYLAVKRGTENVTTLVASKSRVAPPNKLTIPKMEMAGAVLSVKLMQLVQRMFGVFITAYYFWVDSTIVLILIRKEPDTLRTFMANRVAFIQSFTKPEQWGHVAGVGNPADISSRGESMQVLRNSRLWLEGPEFLKSDPETWNSMKLQVLEPVDTSGEECKEKPVFCGTVTVAYEGEVLQATASEYEEIKKELMPSTLFRVPGPTERATLDAILRRYSCWTKTVRLAVIMSRFVDWLSKVGREEKVTKYSDITVSEVNQEEINLLAWEQSITLDAGIVKSNSWKQLLPFWDGIWRVGGRCQFAELNDDVKHPIIIPRESKATQLLVKDAHVSGGHGGIERTLSELRGRFWILGGKTTVKKYIDPCVTCKRLRGEPCGQLMGPLPKERVAPGKPAFTHSGVDLFGPVEVLVKRSRVKRYGAIFTCFNSRAVHLEPVEDLSASAFLDTIERFCMRRTKPATLKSDNGTNFVHSDKELQQADAMLSSKGLRTSLTAKRIEWSFNTPAASHQGGVWERLIRSVRQIVTTLMSETLVTDARFHTILCVAEGVMNSRPLTRLTEDARDLEALTPGHFLGGGKLSAAVGLMRSGDSLRQDWKLSQEIADQCWDRWVAEYLPILMKRTKWIKERPNVKVGELVLVVSDQCNRFEWPLGKILEVHEGKDGLVRNVTLRVSNGLLKRSVQKIVRLELDAT